MTRKHNIRSGKKFWFSQRVASANQKRQKLIGGICTFLLATGGITTSAQAAERLTLKLGPFAPSVEVEDLEQFAQTGQISPSLKPYQPLLTPQAQQILNSSLHIDPELGEKFLEDLLASTEGKQLVEQLVTALPGSSTEQLRTALVQAVRSNEQLSLANFLRAYPSEELTVEVSAAVKVAAQMNSSYWQNKFLSPKLERQLKTQTNIRLPNFDPADAGTQTVRKQTFVLSDRLRQRRIPVDFYYSDDSHGPLIVMSHGYAADRNFLAYLAHHLASHGLTVASVEHPGSNVDSLFSSSVDLNVNKILPAAEFIARPQDISFVLDQLERIIRNRDELKQKFNTEEVVVVGHSFGGYTALALAGAQLNPKELRAACEQLSPFGKSPAEWLECAAADLPFSRLTVRDRRVKGVIAFNPIVGNLFGKTGLTKVNLPVLILSSSEDAITPTVVHQLRPFEQLRSEKYLLSVIGGTHMSVTDVGNLNSMVGRNTLLKELMGVEAEPIRQSVRGVSLAFISQLSEQAELYRPFLTSAYVESLSSPGVPLRLTKDLPKGINTWLNVLYFGNRQITLRKTKDRLLLGRVQKPFASAEKILSQPEYCTGQLDRIFTGLLINYNRHSDRRNASHPSRGGAPGDRLS